MAHQLEPEQSFLHLPRPRAVLLGAALAIALAFLIPYFNLSLNKFDWAFRPVPTGPIFLLFLLIWPINTLLRRCRPGWAFTGPELLLVYAMMAICGALASEGLYGYTTVNSVHARYYASRENRWAELFLSNLPVWLQVDQPEAVRWFFEGRPEGAAIPWHEWVAPMAAWSVFALALYVAFFCLASLLRKDWIEGQRLSFPMAALPIEMAGNPVPSGGSAFFRNPLMWAGFALPVVQSLIQMAHSFAPSVPYSPLYFHLGRWFAGEGPWDSISDTYAYIGFETIGLLALLPAEVCLSLWLFFLVNRTQLLTFAALGFGHEGLGARVFSPSIFITYQEAGGCLMLALLLLWQSRRSLAMAFGGLVGRPVPHDPLDPISHSAAVIGLALSGVFLTYWAYRTGMDLSVFAALMVVFFAYSLVMARLVAAAGVYVPDVSMSPRELLVGLAGSTSYSPASLTMLTYLQATFMLEWKVSFLHYTVDDMKILHSARLPGRPAALALLLAVVLMMLVAPWTNIHAAYQYGANKFDIWQFREMGLGQFGELAANLHTPRAPAAYLPLGLLCGGAVMFVLNWLHTNFIWWGLSPIGFIMGGTWGLGDRIWTNALIAWVVVVGLRKFGGLRLYRRFRPMFLGMALGHFVIIGLRSMIDPMLGLHMQLAAWA